MAGRDLTAGELSRMLAQQCERIVRELLPNGKKQGSEWRAGSVSGEAGESLGVHLTGDKAGVWSDFATGDGGDLLDLIRESANTDVRGACQQAKAMLGIPEGAGLEGGERSYSRPERPKCQAPKSAVKEYLNGRGISDATMQAYRVGERSDKIVFPFLRDGELVMAKEREASDSVSPRPTAANCEPCLFGWQVVPEDARDVIITEGEIDAMSVYEMGFPALSLPYGGGGGNKQQWIENEYDRMAVFDQIYLCLDNDEPGRQAAAEIVKRLGSERIRVVRIANPYKDANNLLTKANFDKARFAELIMRADHLDPTELRNVGDYREQVLGEATLTDLPGIDLPWPKSHGLFRMRYGETVIVAGANGHGKALALDTPIPTPNGWTTMGDIAVGDVVFDENGDRCKVTFATAIQHDRDCFRVRFSDGQEIVCDGEHRWLTHTEKSRRSAERATKNGTAHKHGVNCQTRKRTFPSVVTTNDIHQSIEVSRREKRLKNHSIPVAGALDCDEANLPIDPYQLGAWLGDGHTHQAAITTEDSEVVAAFSEYDPKTQTHQSAGNAITYGLRKGFVKRLREAGVLGDKHIPDIYTRSSKDQRLALLQGLMDTDGHVTTYGRCELTSVKRHIADRVREVVVSLGCQANVIEGNASIDGRVVGRKYRVTFTPDFQAFHLDRKKQRLKESTSNRVKHRFIESCERVHSVPVRCIQVDSPSHLYLCGESMIPTHNTEFAGHLTLAAMANGNRCCVASYEFLPHRWVRRLLRQAAATEDPSEDAMDRGLKWAGDRLWMVDAKGSDRADRTIEVMRYAAKRYGVKFFVIDNLSKCGIADDDYQGQKDFVDRLSEMARELDVVVLLVMHMAKGDESRPGSKMQARGSGQITDLVDSLLILWRNKPKEDAQHAGNTDRDQEPDAKLICEKQRNGETEPRFALWFHAKSHQFVEHPQQFATSFGRSAA